MDKRKTTTSAGAGLSLCEVLGIVFIVLKLVGVIDWSWWLVLLPIYSPIVLFLLGAFIVVICVTIKWCIGRARKKNDR